LLKEESDWNADKADGTDFRRFDRERKALALMETASFCSVVQNKNDIVDSRISF